MEPSSTEQKNSPRSAQHTITDETGGMSEAYCAEDTIVFSRHQCVTALTLRVGQGAGRSAARLFPGWKERPSALNAANSTMIQNSAFMATVSQLFPR